MSLGFLIPPMMVRDHDNLEDIGTDLKLMLYIVAGYCSVLLLTVIFGINYYKTINLFNYKLIISVTDGESSFPSQTSSTAKWGSKPFIQTIVRYFFGILSIAEKHNNQ